tara:strand:+ start:450 stop:650 length:201 start_codon:yes stop_codon:yes gene_type:complete
MYRQLTFEPVVCGSVMSYKGILSDPAIVLTLTSLHEKNYDLCESAHTDRWFFDPEQGFSQTETPYA